MQVIFIYILPERQQNNRHDRRWSCLLSFIFACVVVAFCPVNPLNFLLHFYAIGVWIRSENRWVLFCPVFYKSQCFQASAAFITEAEILMKPARIRRYLISYILKSPLLSMVFRFCLCVLRHFCSICDFFVIRLGDYDKWRCEK